MSYLVVRKHINSDGTATFLCKRSQMSYFTPGGRARLAVKTTWDVEADVAGGVYSDRSRFHFSSKRDALVYFKSLTKGA